jgi:hypothetical protein
MHSARKAIFQTSNNGISLDQLAMSILHQNCAKMCSDHFISNILANYFTI